MTKRTNLELISAPQAKAYSEPNEWQGYDVVYIEAVGTIDFNALEKELIEKGYSNYSIMAKDFCGNHNGYIRSLKE